MITIKKDDVLVLLFCCCVLTVHLESDDNMRVLFSKGKRSVSFR